MEGDITTHLKLVTALAGVGLGAILGALIQRTSFCMANCFTSIRIYGSFLQFKAYMVALFVAMVGTAILIDAALVDARASIYLPTSIPILGYITGGLVFGIGIVFAGGCSTRILARVGEGNLGALVAVLGFNITAGATLAGYLAYLNIEIFRKFTIDLGSSSIPELLGLNHWVLIALFGIALGAWFFLKRADDDFWGVKWPLTGLIIGLVIVAGWYVTGYAYRMALADEFLALDTSFIGQFRPTSITFAKPNADFFEWIAKGSAISVDFAIGSVIGLLLGSLAASLISRAFHWVAPPDAGTFLGYFCGGLLMGFGAIISVGCNFGQGLTGLSVLSVGGLVTIVSIVLGSWIGLWIRERIWDY